VTNVIAPISALLLSVALLLSGNGLQGTLLPIRAGMESFTTPDIGVLGSAYYIGFALGCLYGSRILARAGHIRTFTAMAAVASAVALAHALVVQPWFWWIARASTGFCFAVLFMCIESWLNERATKETRGTVLSIYLIINLTVITAGQLMIMLYDPADWPLFALASILVSLAAVPVALSASPAPPQVQATTVRVWNIYRISPVGFAGCVTVGLANGAFWSLGPSFAQQNGLDISGVAVFMSATVIAGAMGQWPLGRASDRFDRRNVMALACACAGLAGAALASNLLITAGQFLVASCLFGFFAFPVYTIVVAHTNDHVSDGTFVEVSGGLLLLFAAGAVAGPLVASLLMSLVGPGGLYTFTALVHAGMAAFCLYRIHRRERVPLEERTSFLHGLEAANTLSNAFEETEPAPDGETPQRQADGI